MILYLKASIFSLLFILLFESALFSADDIDGGLEKLSLGENPCPHYINLRSEFIKSDEEENSNPSKKEIKKESKTETILSERIERSIIQKSKPQQRIISRRANHGGTINLKFKEGSIEFSDPHYTYNPRNGREHVTFLAKIDKEISRKEHEDNGYKVTTIKETWDDALSKYGDKKLASVGVYFKNDSVEVERVRVNPSKLKNSRDVKINQVPEEFIKQASMFIEYVRATLNEKESDKKGKISEVIKYIHEKSFKDFIIEIPRKGNGSTHIPYEQEPESAWFT